MHRLYEGNARDVPGLRIFFARIADGDLVVEPHSYLSQVLGQLSGADHQHSIARAVNRGENLAVEREAIAGARRAQRDACVLEVESAGDESSLLHLIEQLVHLTCSAQRLQHELDGAAARKAELARVFRSNAIGDGLRSRHVRTLAARALDDVVLD